MSIHFNFSLSLKWEVNQFKETSFPNGSLTLSAPYLSENAITKAKFIFGTTQKLGEKYAKNSLKNVRNDNKKNIIPEIKILICHNLVIYFELFPLSI